MRDDQSYIPSSRNPHEFDDSYQRMIALKRRERWQRRIIIMVGFDLIAFYIILGAVTGWWGTGMIFVPVGGFLMFWGLLREAIIFLSEH